MTTPNMIDLGGLPGNIRRVVLAEDFVLSAQSGRDFDGPVHLEAEIDRVGASVGISGSVHFRLVETCDRCLESFVVVRRLPIDERFELGLENDPFAEASVFSDDQLDVAELLRQAIDAAEPFVSLCKETCAGLCVTCGANLNEGSCRCAATTKGDHG